MAFILKRWECFTRVRSAPFHASTRGKAMAAAWRAYCSYDQVTFREFLSLAKLRRIDPPENYGAPVMIGGERAYAIPAFNGSFEAFVRDDSDDIFYSHPMDVTEIAK